MKAMQKKLSPISAKALLLRYGSERFNSALACAQHDQCSGTFSPTRKCTPMRTL
jgi:hypothetical protein